MTTVSDVPEAWAERCASDPTLRAFVDAEVARAGIELDTLRWQREQDRRVIATLTARLDAADAELRHLRRRAGRPSRLDTPTTETNAP